MNNMKLYLKNYTSHNLYNKLPIQGITETICRKIQGSVIKKNCFPEILPEVPFALLAKIKDSVYVPHLRLVQKITSESDDFTKYVFEGEEQGVFETVRIPLNNNPDNKKYVVCVSSQVGCAMGCSFCATGKMGFVRDLAAWEIVDQVIKVQSDSEFPVTGVVFMGMGEPLMNYEAVIEAAKILSEPCGMAISGKAISISTSGILPVIKKFYNENHPYRLIFSLSSANPVKRAGLMPVELQYPAAEIISYMKLLQENDTRRLTLTWTMISGVTTAEEDIVELAALINGLKVKIDLIDINDINNVYKPPTEEELNLLRDYLKKYVNAPFSRRYSGGKEIGAACGMLGGSGRESHCQ